MPPAEERPRGCGRFLKGCLIIGALVVVVIIALFLTLNIISVWVLRKPEVRNMMICREHMVELGDALTRYRDVHGSYPEDLQDLKKEYLKNPEVLRCPLDKSPGTQPSYTYHKPDANSPDDFVMLECARHRLGSDMPNTRLVLKKDQTFEAIGPTFKETLEEQKRLQEKRSD